MFYKIYNLMYQFFKFSLLFLFTALLLPSCVDETIDDPEVEISNQIAQGATDANVPFTTVSTLVENTTLFGDEGYHFHLFDVETVCSGNFNGDVNFFVKSTTALEVGTYEGSGPYITSSSFFGCDVIITNVSDTEISGKVKGGDPDGDKWIEGSFVATICN